MINRLKNLLVTLFLVCVPIVAATGVAHAAYDATGGLCADAAKNNNGENPAICNDTPTNPVTGTDSLIMKATNIIAVVAGVVAVVMIVYSGLQMIMSSGDAAKFTQARNTIIYTAVGIAVIVLAKTIISFILKRI